MYIGIYVYMYICIYVYMYICIYVYIKNNETKIFLFDFLLFKQTLSLS